MYSSENTGSRNEDGSTNCKQEFGSTYFTVINFFRETAKSLNACQRFLVDKSVGGSKTV